MSPSERLKRREAFALGLLQGPAELLPISSSAHTTLLPWLAGWDLAAGGNRERRELEVALHAGAAVALAQGLPGSWRTGRLRVLVPALAIPSAAGFALERAIDERLSGPRAIAGGLVAGACAMIAADRLAPIAGRRSESAGWRDGVGFGLAQAAALVPGVSRSGAVLAAARARGYAAAEAEALSWQVGLPVIVAATTLKAVRGWRRGGDRRVSGGELAAGAAGALLSSALSLRMRLGGRPAEHLSRFGAYRIALALATAVRWRSGDRRLLGGKRQVA